MRAADMTPEQRQRKREAKRRWQANKRNDPEWLAERRRYNRHLMRRHRRGMSSVGLTEQLKAERATTPMCECGRVPGSCVPCGGTEAVA